MNCYLLHKTFIWRLQLHLIWKSEVSFSHKDVLVSFLDIIIALIIFQLKQNKKPSCFLYLNYFKLWVSQRVLETVIARSPACMN